MATPVRQEDPSHRRWQDRYNSARIELTMINAASAALLPLLAILWAVGASAIWWRQLSRPWLFAVTALFGFIRGHSVSLVVKEWIIRSQQNLNSFRGVSKPIDHVTVPQYFIEYSSTKPISLFRQEPMG